MSRSVTLVRSELGGIHIAVELAKLQSVLTSAQAGSILTVDIARRMGAGRYKNEHIGLIDQHHGPPIGLCLGMVSGFFEISIEHIRRLPEWTLGFVPEFLYPACAIDDSGEAIWLIDVLKIRAT